MARKQKSKGEDVVETDGAEVFQTGSALEIVEGDAPLVPSVEHHGSVKLEPPTAEEMKAVPEVRRYRVMNSGRVMNNGFIVTIHAGKIVDDSNYNIEALRRQGLDLKREP